MNIGVVPARLASKRLPKKILADLDGKPMVAHTMEQVLKAQKLDKVILAIDSEESFNALKDFGFDMVMTSKDHCSGTDRVAEVVKKNEDAEVIINIQGDEPLIDANIIDDLLGLFEDKDVNMGTAISTKLRVDDLLDDNVVKAIIDQDKNVIDFKRNIYDSEIGGLYRHIGIYGFRRNTLFQFSMLDQSPREKKRKLEQMRALDNDLPIRATITGFESFAVDTKSDLNKVLQIMEAKEIGLD